MIQKFYAHGKLLLTGEYFVLDGAKALALPCRLGQSMTVRISEDSNYTLNWKSFDHGGAIWFEGSFKLNNFKQIKSSDQSISNTLQNILGTIRKQNPFFLKEHASIEVETKLEFPRLWGLGTSSTLIYNLAQWSKTDPFNLLEDTFGGSGYDIACAGVDDPIIYEKSEDGPKFIKADFDPPFKEHLNFVYLGKKQNSRDGIKHYRENVEKHSTLIKKVSELTEMAKNAKQLIGFKKALNAHENLVSKALKLPRVQDQFFNDFPGTIKSLGAWGGDFVLAVSDLDTTKTQKYFNEKGFEVFLKYEELIMKT